MSDPQRDDTFDSISAEIVAFRDARDWAQFHTPRNLAAALAIEAAELQEVLLWQTDEEAAGFLSTDQGQKAVSQEVADVMIYALLLCHTLGIDPRAAIEGKLDTNETRYPAELARGRSAKYTKPTVKQDRGLPTE